MEKNKKLSPEEKQQLVENANDFIDVFSSIFGINVDHITPDEVKDFNFFDLTDNKDTSTDSDKEKNTEEEKTDNNVFKFDIDFSDLASVISGLVDGFTNKKDNKEKQENNKSEEKETNIKNTCDNKCSCSKNDILNSTEICNKAKDRNNVKQRLIEEAEFDKEKFEQKLKENIFEKIKNILEDEKTHNYKIHKKTDKNPAAAEINLSKQNIYIKNHIYILKDLENKIKTHYDFNDVFINYTTNQNNKEYINLNVYMIL